MTWMPWPDRLAEFAPTLCLHPLDPYYPTTVEAFLERSCGLQIWMGVPPTPTTPPTLPHPTFDRLPFVEKIQWMLHPKTNHAYSFLDRHGGRVDPAASARIQRRYGRRPTVYAHGQRNPQTGEAYLIYNFFFVENFVPMTEDPDALRDKVAGDLTPWWTHEGDWEAISIHFEDYADAPDTVYFSRHSTYGRRQWERARKSDDGRVLAFSALGTHASYNKVLSKRRLGFYFDITSDGRRYAPRTSGRPSAGAYHLEVLDPHTKHLWLHFKGGWGKSGNPYGGVKSHGPSGPLTKSKKPFRWRSDPRAPLPPTAAPPPLPA